MIRLIAVAFALTLASSAQAMPPIALQQTDEMVIRVLEGCGPGMVRTAGGVCVSRAARRAVRRCLRWNAGVCARYAD